MNLSTRLTAAMVSLVLLTATGVSVLIYRNIETRALATTTARLEVRAAQEADRLATLLSYVQADLLAVQYWPVTEGLRRSGEPALR